MKALSQRLAEIERAARQLREMLPDIPGMEIAVRIDNPDSMMRWQAGELTRVSEELVKSAQGLKDIAASFSGGHDT